MYMVVLHNKSTYSSTIQKFQQFSKISGENVSSTQPFSMYDATNKYMADNFDCVCSSQNIFDHLNMLNILACQLAQFPSCLLVYMANIHQEQHYIIDMQVTSLKSLLFHVRPINVIFSNRFLFVYQIKGFQCLLSNKIIRLTISKGQILIFTFGYNSL